MSMPPTPMLSTPRTSPPSRRVTLNVGGMRHEAQWRTLERDPHSRLGRLRNCESAEAIALLCDDFSLNENEYFFDRSPDTFSMILNYYRTGKLHLPQGVCIVAFCDELQYWGVQERHMQVCCENDYYSKKEVVEDDMRKNAEALVKHLEVEDFGPGKCAKNKRWLWDTLEKPTTSKLAMVVVIISTLFILVSTAGLVVGSLPMMHVELVVMIVSTLFIMVSTAGLIAGSLPQMQVTSEKGELVEHPALEVLEAVCIAWFTIEFIARFISAPNRCEFLKSPLNVIDIMSIVPYYVVLIIVSATSSTESTGEIGRVVQVFRIMRVMRILKLARHSKGLQALGFTLASSYKELALLVFFLAMGVLLFSSLEYFAEKAEPETTFTSIPATFWWAAITMTTVGYGDMAPTSVMGKIISTACCIAGVLFIALPIPVIVNNFAQFHLSQIKIDKSLKRYDERQAQVAAHSKVKSKGAHPKEKMPLQAPHHSSR